RLEGSRAPRPWGGWPALAGVHPRHPPRVSPAPLGCSMGECVQPRRIALASRMLLEKRRPLASVADALGYYDQSHFTRAFKLRAGVTPGQYRAAAGGDVRPDEDAPIVQDETARQGAS